MVYVVEVDDLPVEVLGMGPRSLSQNVTSSTLHYGDACLSLLLHQGLVKERLLGCKTGKPNPQKLRFFVFTSVYCLIPVLCTERKAIFLAANEAFICWLAGICVISCSGWGNGNKPFLFSMADHNFDLLSISYHCIHLYAIILINICIIHHECCRS